MRTYEVAVRIHAHIRNCRSWIANERGLLWWLDKSLTNDGPHPDDIAELDAMLAGDAETCRELAHKLEMRRLALKANALQYQLEAIEAAE